MSKKFTKRALSLLIALALTISLLPSVVFAAEDSVVLDFMNNTGFTVSENASVKLDISKTNNKQFKFYKLSGNPSGAAYPWVRPEKEMMKFTIETEALSEGYYNVDLTGGAYTDGSYFYVYVNDEYAGMCSFYTDGNLVENASEITQNLKTVKVVPDDGKVRITFAFAGAGASTVSGYYGKAYPKTLKFTLNDSYTEPAIASVVADGLMEKMIVGQVADVSAYVNMSDGVFVTNNYTVDKAVSSEDFVDVEIVDNPDNAVSLVDTEGYAYEAYFETFDSRGGKYHSHFNGTYNGTLTALAAGTATIKITAIVNGNDYSETKTITVADTNAPIKLEFNSTTLEDTDSSKSGVQGKTLGTKDGVNYEVVTSKSTELNVGLYSSMLRVSGYVGEEKTTGNSTVWVQHPNHETQRGMLTVKTKVPEGNYRVDFAGAPMSYGGMIYIYADGKLAGIYNCNNNDVLKYPAANTNNKVSVDYGVIEITPDADGYAEIQFCTAAASDGKDSSSTDINDGVYDGVDMLISSITLTPTTDAAPTLSSVSVKSGDTAIAENNTIDMGENLTFTAEAMMDDGKARHINGHTADGELDPDNKIDVSVDGSSVRYDVVNYYVKDADADNKAMYDANGIYSGKLTAVAPGTSTVTVTATVNGSAKSESFTVTVPYADTDAEDIDNTISYIVRAEERANDSKVTVSDANYTVNGTNVGSWTVDTSFTATAEPEGFAYWANGSGTPVSESPSYTFEPTSNFTLEAVYVPAEPTDADKKVQFWNYNRVFLGEETVTDGKVTKLPTQPTLAGHTFAGWAAENIGAFTADTPLTAALTRVVAQFTADANKYSVKVDGVEVGKYAYGAPFETTADATNGNQVFSHWAIGDKVVSYDSTIRFYVWNNVELTAVYADVAPTAVPTVVLDNIGDEYFITYEAPSGYTAIDAGIVFGTNGTTPRVDSTDGSKASVKKAGAKGQFTAAPHKDAAANTVARGYVMYRDTNNNLRILYTEAK